MAQKDPFNVRQIIQTQKDYFSGKKKHCVKNNMITTPQHEVLYLSETYEGSVHDITIVKKEEDWQFPENIVVYQDTGFQGHAPRNVLVMQPLKNQKAKN